MYEYGVFHMYNVILLHYSKNTEFFMSLLKINLVEMLLSSFHVELLHNT
jgi:hypothetical protein